jgi:hypothetical protein
MSRKLTIGFLGATNPTIWGTFLAAFDKRLRKHGWVATAATLPSR